MSADVAQESSPTGLTKVTCNLGRRTVGDLDALCEALGVNRTDAINRAISLARLFVELGDGRSVRVVGADGSTERIHLL